MEAAQLLRALADEIEEKGRLNLEGLILLLPSSFRVEFVKGENRIEVV